MELTHDERAENGAAIFDKEWGDAWWRNYPLDKLKSVMSCGCAADYAQLAATGEYLDSDNQDGYDHLCFADSFSGLGYSGYYGCAAMNNEDDALMVAAWKRLILRRRAEAARVEPAKPPVLLKGVEQCLALAK